MIDGPYKLDEVPKAFRLCGTGHHKGKVVITVEHNTDEAFRQLIDERRGLELIHGRRREIASTLEAEGIGKGGGSRVH